MGSRGASLEELEALYRRELPRFVRAASAIVGSEARGADVVQDAFASAVRARRSFRREVAQERRRTPAEVELADAVAVDENGFGAGDPGVRRWVAALPERQRVMVFLRYFAGLDYRSVAEALEVEVGTVSATLAAAHAALRRSLQEVER
jgi:DNA-directed RNA polymerase specialized sigma24 family protein